MSLGGAALFVKNLCHHSTHTHHILGIQKKWNIMSVDHIPYFECLMEDEVLALIKRERYDLLHWHWWQPLALMRFLAETEVQLPNIVTVHVYGCQAPYQLTAFERDYAHKIVFVTPAALNLPENRMIHPDKVLMITAGADLAPFLNLKPARHKGFVIGRASVLNRLKCPLGLIDTYRRVDIPEATFIIAGDGELRKEFTQSLGTDGDGHRFTFPGFLSDMPSFYAGLDLYCYQLPADSYAASELNIQEAMAAALPIVFLPSPGAQHLIEHGVTGMVARDEDELIDYCQILHADPLLCFQLGRNARERAAAEFGIHNSATSFDRLFEEIVATTPSVTPVPLTARS